MLHPKRSWIWPTLAIVILVSAGCANDTDWAGGSPVPPPEGDVIALTQPALEVPLPNGWAEESIQDVRDQVAEQAQQLPRNLRRTFMMLAREIDQGVIVAEAIGPPVANSGYTPSILVSVESGDGSLRAAAKRRELHLQSASPGMVQQFSDRMRVTLPVGQAIRITARANPPAGVGIPSQTVEYLLLLDGRTVSLLGTAPADYIEFPELMARVVEGVRRA